MFVSAILKTHGMIRFAEVSPPPPDSKQTSREFLSFFVSSQYFSFLKTENSRPSGKALPSLESVSELQASMVVFERLIHMH